MTRIQAPEEMPASISENTPEQVEMMEAVAEAWRFLPDWDLSRIISSAADISLGAYRSTPRGMSDEELLSGLRALTPDEWEKENA